MPYGDVSGLEQYALDTGRTLPSGANLTAALYNASMYIDGTYWDDFCGEPATDDAAFPRKGQSSVPQRVINATYEAAIQWLGDKGSLTLGGSAGGQVIREKVDGAVEVAYAAPSGDFLADGTPLYSAIEGLLKPLLCRPVEGGSGGYAFVV